MSRGKTIKRKQKNIYSSLISGAGTLTGITAAAAGGWILYSNLVINHSLPLPYAMNAERIEFASNTAGKVSYYADHQKAGRPLVLIHSVNAAASTFEMKPLFEYFRTNRPVFALDLPGFGFSGRPARSYHPMVYEDVITEWLENHVKEPADVIALSLGSEFSAAASVRHPDLFHSLAFISPTGFSTRASSTAGGSEGLYSLFTLPLWRRPLYDLLVTRASLRFFLQKSLVGPVPSGLLNYSYFTSHRPGAEYAPLAFISGKLFTPAVRDTVYTRVKKPTLVIYDRDGYTSFDALPPFLEKNTSWRAVKLFPSLGLPQFEKLKDLILELEVFWKET